jgi:hypothetical protein
MEASSSAYPATLTVDPQERIANWRPLVQWLLAIPHWFVVAALGAVSQILTVISWFAILFTGRLPEGLANFQAMYLRYTVRAGLYAGFIREEYPPFSFEMAQTDPGDDPRIRVDTPAQLDGRNRLTVGFRFLLGIPHVIWMALVGIAAFAVWFVAFFAVLFTGRWPAGMRRFVLRFEAYWLRVQAYLLLLRDEYPTFSLS